MTHLNTKTALFLFFLLPLFSLAQPIEQYQQFNGRYDFTAIGNTLNDDPNPNGCDDLLLQSSADLNLDPDQTVVAAYLYWAGPGTIFQADLDVEINGTPVSAERTFNTIMGTNPFFGAFVDVTAIVNFNGNGTYTFSELDLTHILVDGNPYCGNATNFAGWSIVVIYEDLDLPNNAVSVYDGFRTVDSNNNNIFITLENLNVIATENAKIGFLAWEGDEALASNEELNINTVLMSNPPLNPSNNAFNGTNSYTGSDELWNMDLDFYDIEDVINVGDTELDINLRSTADGVIVHNVVVNLSSELPDATIVIDNVTGDDICGNRDIEVDYTVFNSNSTDVIPANTPISFYANTTYLDTTTTTAVIPMGGSESGTITLTIPDAIPYDFDLIAVVDDIGDGTGIVDETNEENNKFTEPISFPELVVLPTLYDLEECGVFGEHVFDLTEATVDVDPDLIVSYHLSFEDAEDNDDPILTPTTFVNDSPPQTIYIRVFNGECFDIGTVTVNTLPVPTLIDPTPLQVCDDLPEDGFTFFDLHDKDDEITGSNPNYDVLYFETLAESEVGDPDTAISDPYQNTTIDAQTVFVRVNDITNGCHSLTTLDIEVLPLPDPLLDIPNYELCDDDENGTEIFDLTTKTDEILNGLPAASYTVTYYVTEDQAHAGTPEIGTPDVFNSAGQTIYVRVENNVTSCYLVVSFEIVVNPLPIPEPANTIIVCDLNDDGLATFYLLVAEAQLLGAQTDITVTYYTTLAGAEDGTFDQILTPDAYVNEDTPFQTIFVRLENDITGCYQTSSFLIEVRPVDFIPFELEDFELCVTADSDIGVSIDLTEQEQYIFGDEDPDDYTVTYHLTQGEAAAGTGAFPDPTNYLNVENPQVIWVRLVNNVINCVEIGSFTVQVYLNPVVTAPEDMTTYELCDDAVADGLTGPFDLYTKLPEITAEPDVNVSFYESQADAEAPANPLPLTGYTNTVPDVQTIYVRIEDPATGCVVYTTFDLIVNENPPILGAGPLTFCDPDNDGFGEFILTDADDAITGGDPDLVVSYHDTPENAGSGTLPITGV